MENLKETPKISQTAKTCKKYVRSEHGEITNIQEKVNGQDGSREITYNTSGGTTVVVDYGIQGLNNIEEISPPTEKNATPDITEEVRGIRQAVGVEY